MKRRTLLALPAALLPSIGLSADSESGLRPLTVSAFGGVFQEAFTRYVASKFTDETGIVVKVVSQAWTIPGFLVLLTRLEMGLHRSI